MREPGIPDDVRRFVLTSVPSVPFMEAMLVFRARHGERLTTRNIGEWLYMSEEAAAGFVAQLVASRIIRPAETDRASHRFAPESDELAEMLDRVASCYSSNLIEMTDLIHAKTERKARHFADAFRLRKDP
ncbi:MAG: alkaline phosphatase family protein [Pseudomonadota bacterium]|nr:alkaline phosphatase family protein [Pseudomonadota bacterium]